MTHPLKLKRLLNRYKNWLLGLSDRQTNQGCKSAHGDYLDGFYSTNTIPDFLTNQQASDFRKLIKTDQKD